MTITITGKVTGTGKIKIPNHIPPREPGDYAITMGGYGYLPYTYKRAISTLGNASSSGNLTTARQEAAGASNGADGRAISAGGMAQGSNQLSSIEYRQITTGGNGFFSNLTTSRRNFVGLSNSINNRAVFTGGIDFNAGNAFISDAEYYTISAASSASAYGNLLNHIDSAGTSNGSNDRAVYNRGGASMRYITISTLGTSSSFPSLFSSKPRTAAASNSINDKALFGGGATEFTTGMFTATDLVNIGTAASASFFGDLTVARGRLTAGANGINERVIFIGGRQEGTDSIVIDYFTIDSTSNALPFGSLPRVMSSMSYADNGGT